MALNLLLTVDLNSVKDNQREKFYEYLEERNLKKTNLTTTWKATWSKPITYQAAVNVIKEILKSAAQKANILNYEAQFMISEDEAVSVRQ